MPKPVPKTKLLQTSVPTDVYETLAEMAATAGKTLDETTEALLTAIVDDDREAHGIDHEATRARRAGELIDV